MMKWFYNLKTMVKLIAAFLVISAIMAFIGLYGLSNLGKTNSSLNDMYNNQLQAVAELQNAKIGLGEMRMLVRKLYMAPNTEVVEETKTRMYSQMEQVEEGISGFMETELTEESKAGLANFQQMWPEYQNAVTRAIEIRESENFEQLSAFIEGEYLALVNQFGSSA